MEGRDDDLHGGHNRFLTLMVLKLAVVWTAMRIDYTALGKSGESKNRRKQNHTNQEKSHHVSAHSSTRLSKS